MSGTSANGSLRPLSIELTDPAWLDHVAARMLIDYPGSASKDRDNPIKRYVDMEHLLENLQPPTASVLLEQMATSFSIEELRNICLLIQVEYEEIAGTDSRSFAREMWRYFARRGRTRELMAMLRQKRPNIDWPVPYEG